MQINIPISIKVEVTKEFEQKYEIAMNKVATHIKENIQNKMPGVRTKSALKTEIDINKGVGRIGWQKGSHEEMVGSVLETGSGERGRDGGTYKSGVSGKAYRSPFGDTKPKYTVPIVPTKKKYMSFKGKNGPVFMKEFKGHIPKYYFSSGVTESMKFLPLIFENEMNK